MFCSSCGHQLNETDVLCPTCGRIVEDEDAFNEENEQEVIESYFLAGFEYETICLFCLSTMVLTIQCPRSNDG